MSDEFKLERMKINDKERHGFTPEGLLVNYREALDEKETRFLPCLESVITIIYSGAGPELKLYLDEVFPSIKIGKIILPITRANNPRVLVVKSPKNNDLVIAIISLAYTRPLSDKERVKAYNELIVLGLKKSIVGPPLDYVAKILGVSTKTLERDLKNAK